MQAVETEGREIDKDIYKLLVETGMRREELLGMPWREVNLDDGVIRLDPERSKTDQGRFIPLSDTALTILQRRKAGSPDHDHVITYPDGRRMTYPEYFWDRIRKAAKLPGVRIHDLRHTFATMTRVGGLAREDRKAIMGHSSEEAHDLYAAASVDALREVLNRASPLTQLEHRTCTPT
jgi:integrase